jgi:hypothetical protein
MNYQPGPHRSRAAAVVVATWIRQLWSQGTVAEAGKQGEITTASNKSFLGLVLAVFSLGNGLLVGWIIAGIARGQGANSVALVTSGGGVLLAVLAIVFAVMGIAEVNGSSTPMYGRETSGVAIGVAVVGAILSGLQSLMYFS